MSSSPPPAFPGPTGSRVVLHTGNGAAAAAVRPRGSIATQQPAEEGPDWARATNAVFRFKWLILAITVIASMGGVVLSHFTKPTYRAEATIWIDQASRRQNDRGPAGPARVFSAEAWTDLLSSYTVLDNV